MPWFIMGVVIMVIGLVPFAIGKVNLGPEPYSSGRGEDRIYPIRWVGVVIIAFGALLTVPSFFYTQSVGEVVILKGASGQVLEVDTSPGIGMSAPWTKKIGWDVRNQKIEMFSNDGGLGQDGARINAPLKNGSDVGVSITVLYSLKADPDSIEDLYRQYRSQDRFRELALLPDVRDVTRESTGSYTAFEVKQARGEMTDFIRSGLEETWGDFGATVEDVNLGALGLGAETEKSIDALNQRQAEAEAQRAALEKEQLAAEVTKTKALAEQAADQITRCGATVRSETRVVAGQETTVQVVTPVPIEQCQNLLNEQVLTKQYIETLAKLGENGNVIVVPNGANVTNLLSPNAGR